MKCGRHVDDPDRDLCHECSEKDHSYGTGIAVFEYDKLMRDSMINFKFNRWRDNADFYVEEAVARHRDRILACRPSAMIPVPTHYNRKSVRGYNQAELLANGIGEALNIPVVSDLLIRRHDTGFQKKLGAGDRVHNLEHAFDCNRVIYDNGEIARRFPRVMLVDDIYTTGSTVEHCTRTLLEYGVQHVDILCICIGQGYD